MATYLVIILFVFSGSVYSSKKVWIPNTNFENVGNWKPERKPCSNDRVIISRDDSVSIFVQENVFVREIILSLNGELILPIKGEIRLGTKKSDGCNGEDIMFRGRNVFDWYDPINWDVLKDSDVGRLTDVQEVLVPIPHTEKVPCPSDTVVFPPNSTFSVRVEGLETVVGRFQINRKNLDSEGLRSFLRSETGIKQFKVDNSLSLNSRSECSDVSGCACGNDSPDVMRRICFHATRDGCPIPMCVDPIIPVGSCCAVCGSTITVTTDEYFQFKKLKELYTFYLQKPFYKNVAGYMFKTYLGQIQTIFYDPTELHRTRKLVDDIRKQTFENDFERARLNVVSFKMESTTDWSHSSAEYSSIGLGTGFWVALIFGLISLAIIGFLFFIQRAQLMAIAFPFGRFDNEYDRDGGFEYDVELTQTANSRYTAESQISADSDELKGFDNPYYDASRKDASDIIEISSAEGKSYETLHTRQNPCYMAFERVEDVPGVSDTETEDISKSKLDD